MRAVLLALLALVVAPLHAAPAPLPLPLPRVVLDTSEGRIVVALEVKRAPITAANFLRYVDEKRYDHTTFYRAARSGPGGRFGLVQGGIDNDIRRSRLPIRHEPTSLTGLRHVDGTISMARNEPGSAAGNFFIVVGPGPHLDAKGSYVGYAAFGHVVAGMDVVRRILAQPTWPGGYSANTMGQSIRRRVAIRTVRNYP